MLDEFLINGMHDQIKFFLQEDGVYNNFYYLSKLPKDPVKVELIFKSDLVVAGLPFFYAVFLELGAVNNFSLDLEGKLVKAGEKIKFFLPFNIALTGERLALNMLQRASSIATQVKPFADKAKKFDIKILDTRKTSPGLRILDKYGVRIGGGYNHRFSQSDIWMIKDNHKEFFGGTNKAIEFFKEIGAFYNQLIMEIHSVSEFEECKDQVKYFMLDNFSLQDIDVVLTKKNKDTIIELSGGINETNFESYLKKGVDAISMGGLTHSVKSVDISLNMEKLSNYV